jgi:hypothetical protein
MIRVTTTPIGHEVRIDFYDWEIYIDLADADMSEQGISSDLCICDKTGKDITEEFLMFHPDVTNIRPTGPNLFTMMGLLAANLKERGLK